MNRSPWRRCLCPVLLAAVLGANGFVLAPTAAATPRTAGSGDPAGAGDLHGAQSVVASHGSTGGRGRDDDESNEADGVSQTQESTSEADVISGGGGGGSNIVRLRNPQDGRLRIRGNVDLNRIHGPRVMPRNLAAAEASCTDCQTVVVALQLNLYERTASQVAPQNVALAVNTGCTNCTTIAVAIQYDLPVDDPNNTPGDVDGLIRAMDQELQDLHGGKQTTAAGAEADLNDVIARFTTLAESLDKQRAESTAQNDPTPTPTPVPTAAAPGSPAAAPTTDGGASITPVATVGATPTATVGASVSPTPPAPPPSPAPGP